MAVKKNRADGMRHSLMCHWQKDSLMLLLIRHGQPGPAKKPDPALKNFDGLPLTRVGLRQAEHLGKRLAGLPINHIYCSTMSRSYQTALAVKKHHPRVPFEIREEIREVASAHFPYHPYPREASLRQRVAREKLAVDRFVRRLRRRHKPGEVVAIVAHGNLNNLLTAVLADKPLRQLVTSSYSHAAITMLRCNSNGRVVASVANCTRHLPASLLGTINLETPKQPPVATTPPDATTDSKISAAKSKSSANGVPQSKTGAANPRTQRLNRRRSLSIASPRRIKSLAKK